MRITEIITTYVYDAADIDFVLEGLEVEDLKAPMLARIGGFTELEKVHLLTRHRRPELVGEAIELFARAGAYRGAEALERAVLLPLCGVLRAEHVRRILEAAEQNDQIHDASGTRSFMAEMFDRTADLLRETGDAWQKFMAAMSQGKAPDDLNVYPQLRIRMEAAGIWPPPAPQAAPPEPV